MFDFKKMVDFIRDLKILMILKAVINGVFKRMNFIF